MGLFGKRRGVLLSPVNGECVGIEKIKDEAFANKLCGDGAAVISEDGVFVSPADGVISGIAESLHAFSITTDDGLELLLHIGIDTVELRGEGFSPCVSVGSRVSVGERICEVSLELLKNKGYDISSPVVIVNADEVKRLRVREGRAEAGRGIIMEYEK